MAADTLDISIQHSSLQAQDDRIQHAKDAEKLFDLATKNDIWACTGTEAGMSDDNNLHYVISEAAARHDFYIFAHKYGEWVALNKRHLENFEHEYMGPFVQGASGRGGHTPRGVTVASASCVHHDIGTLAFASAHLLTDRSTEQHDQSNAPMFEGIHKYGIKYGIGMNKAFFCGDMNENDAKKDVFHGAPFTSLADELGKHPATHGKNKGHGFDIDVIASFDEDKVVKGVGYRVLDDSDVKLFGDHFVLQGTYRVRI